MQSLREQLYRFYWRSESAIVPGLRNSQYAYYEKLKPLVRGADWLELGCGRHVFSAWMANEQDELVASCKAVYGIDLDAEGMQANRAIVNKVFGDLAALPFRSESIDVASANMVAEHLPQPEPVLAEIYRVLRPNGIFIFHTPNFNGWFIRIASLIPDALKRKLVRIIEGRREEDVFPTRYRMNTDAAISRMAVNTGFEVEDIASVSSSAATAVFGPVAWLELLYIRWLQRPQRAKLRSNMVVVLRKQAHAKSATA